MATPGTSLFAKDAASRAGPSGTDRISARRRFLAACAGLVISAIAGQPAGASRGPGDPVSGDDPAGSLLRDPDAAAVLGRRYLAACPGKADTGWLRGITGATGNGRIPQDGFLSRRVRADFSKGDTVTVDGWVMARTEARFCALVAIDESRREKV